MAAYLTDRPPVRDQWYEKRNRALTGCTVLHTSENILDTVGPDTGTDNLAEFIRNRTTPGSYHDVADSDSNLQLVEYEYGAFHDATGSNNWALSISFVCRTVDWARMTPARRKGFLRQGALAFARQQNYRRRIGAPLTELRRITKAQSDAGESGFVYHGDRDPGRRTDPGTTAAAPFPFDEFITECRAVMAGEEKEEDDMPPFSQWPVEEKNEFGEWLIAWVLPRVADVYARAVLQRTFPKRGPGATGDTSLEQEVAWLPANLAAVIAAAGSGGDPEALAAALREVLGDDLAADVASRLRITPA